MVKRIAVVVAALVVALIVSPFAAIGYAMARNNHDMNEWRKSFYEVSDLDHALVVSSGSRFGLQPNTNGNHCDREAWIVYRTSLEPQQVEDHFLAELNPEDGELWVTADAEARTVRVDYWYRFDDPGWDFRCM